MDLKSATPIAFVNVTDRARGDAFYGELLGLQLKSADEFGSFYESGGGLVRITPLEGHVAHPHPVLGWSVPDIGATARALRDQGVTLTVYDSMGQDADGVWTSPDGKVKVAWFADPDGNVLSLTEG